MFEIGKPVCGKNTVTGQTFHFQQITRTPAKNPTQKPQTVEATVILKAATFTEKAVTEKAIYYMPFMEAVRAAQARWPGKSISYRTLGWKPAPTQEGS